MTIKLYNGQPCDRLFTAYCSAEDTPRGVYDEVIDLAVTGATGYVDRDALRAVARRELKRRNLLADGVTVRRIARLA